MLQEYYLQWSLNSHLKQLQASFARQCQAFYLSELAILSLFPIAKELLRRQLGQPLSPLSLRSFALQLLVSLRARFLVFVPALAPS